MEDKLLKSEKDNAPARRAKIFGIILFVLGISAIYIRISNLDLHPQLILFIYSIPANSAWSIFSHEVALLDYGSHQPILLSAFTAVLGTIVAGYLDWHVFVPLLNWKKLSAYRRYRFYAYCIDKFKKAPFIVLLVTGFTPIPFLPFKFLAFSMEYPLRRYLAAVTLSRFSRYYLLAWLGKSYDIPKWILLLMLVVILIPAVWGFVRGRGEIKLKNEKTG